jgi:hypothetical protein
VGGWKKIKKTRRKYPNEETKKNGLPTEKYIRWKRIK